MIIMAGAISAKADVMTLSFTNASGNAFGRLLTLNTESNTVSGTGLIEAHALSGTSTVDDEFTLNVKAGYDFDSAAPTWDTTAPTNGTNSKIHYESNGMAPGGGTDMFADGEILWFTVSGLEEGNSLNLSSFTLNGGLAKRVDFYYEHTSGTDGIQWFNSTATMPNAIDLTFSNDDIFGLAYYNTDGGTKGYLSEITFDVIPEPATLGLIASSGIGVLFIRRRLMM